MMTRTRRRCIVWIALVALLFTQFAVAAYACPAFKTVSAAASTAVIANDCIGMSAKANQADPDNPSLCFQHCQQGTQHSDHAEIPSLLPVLGLLLTIGWAHHPSPLTAIPSILSAQEFKLARASPPPTSILYCCWRI